MSAPTPEAIENARLKVQQAKARLQALEARAATLSRKADARRKIILGGLRSLRSAPYSALVIRYTVEDFAHLVLLE